MARSFVRYFFCAFVFFVFMNSPILAEASLSPSNAFTLIKKIPPGLPLSQAETFLGAHISERLVEEVIPIKVRRWEIKGEWALDMLHDDKQVRAVRVIWLTQANGEKSRLFGGLTRAGRDNFGRAGVFKGLNEASWKEMDGNWLIVASKSDKGVTLLSAIRDRKKGSDKYGF